MQVMIFVWVLKHDPSNLNSQNSFLKFDVKQAGVKKKNKTLMFRHLTLTLSHS